MEIHGTGRRHDVRYVRKPRQRRGAQSPAGQEGPSRKKGETTVFAAQPLNEDALRAAIAATGYEVGGIRCEEAKKGLLGWQ